MKVSIAVIKLVLRTNKTLADGSHPIMLRVSFNGMKERSSGYSCTEKYWSKKDECVKKGFPNYAIINHEIQKMKNEACQAGKIRLFRVRILLLYLLSRSLTLMARHYKYLNLYMFSC